MPWEKMLTDRELIARTLKNKNSFALIVERYHQAIKRYIVHLGCKNKNDADDLLQEIFLKVYVNLNDYDTSLKFSSWLYRIAHNETISHFRKQNAGLVCFELKDSVLLFDKMKNDDDGEYEFRRTNDSRLLNEAVKQLVPVQREALILKYFEEKSYTEISDIMRIPMGTVATIISRGKTNLKKLLSRPNRSEHEK